MRVLIFAVLIFSAASLPAHAEYPPGSIRWHGGLLVPMRPPAPHPPQAPSPRSGLPIITTLPQASGSPRPAVAASGDGAGQQCRGAIMAAERAAGIPTQLMAAIARVESGRRDARGVVQPWPWTINAEGTGSVYDTKAEAIAAVRRLQASGVRSIDVGCMQVNLMYHPDAFATLEEAFDPSVNARYAASFLNRLYAQTGDWTRATAAYHSFNPALGDSYQRKVAAVLPDEMKRVGEAAQGQPNVWSVNAWTANAWNTGAPPAFAGRAGGFMLNHGTATAKIIPMAPGASGRGLDAYRRSPVPMIASR